MREAPYGFGAVYAIGEGLRKDLSAEVSRKTKQSGSTIELLCEQEKQTIYVAFTDWRSPATQLVDIGYVCLIVEDETKELEDAEKYLYYFISFVDIITLNKSNKPSVNAVIKQLTKFVEDSRRPEEERFYRKDADGNPIGRFGGGVTMLPANYDETLEAQCLADLPVVNKVKE